MKRISQLKGIILLLILVSCQTDEVQIPNGYYKYYAKLDSGLYSTQIRVSNDSIFKYGAMKCYDTTSVIPYLRSTMDLYSRYKRDNSPIWIENGENYVLFKHLPIDSTTKASRLKEIERLKKDGLSNREIQQRLKTRRIFEEIGQDLPIGYTDTLWRMSEEEFLESQLTQ